MTKNIDIINAAVELISRLSVFPGRNSAQYYTELFWHHVLVSLA